MLQHLCHWYIISLVSIFTMVVSLVVSIFTVMLWQVKALDNFIMSSSEACPDPDLPTLLCKLLLSYFSFLLLLQYIIIFKLLV